MNIKRAFWFLKVIILFLLIYMIYQQLFISSNVRDLWSLFTTQFNWQHIYFLLLAIILIPINWGLETVKWSVLMHKTTQWSFREAFRSVLMGVTVSMFMPNRMGEFAGRITFLAHKDQPKGILYSLVTSIAQIQVTIIAGVFALYYYFNHFLNETSWEAKLLIVVSSLLCLVTFIFYLNLIWLGKIAHTFFSKKKWLQHVTVLKDLSYKQLHVVWIISLFRYITYTAQYLFLLKMFGIEYSFENVVVMISLTFLTQTIIPSLGLADIGIRGNASLYFIGQLTSNKLAVLGAANILWIINLMIPALTGAYYLWQIKLDKMISVAKKSRIKIRSSIVIIMLFLSPSIIGAQECEIVNNSYRPGESLTYKIQYNWGLLWVGAGEVTFSVEESVYKGRSVYHMSGIGSTYSTYDWFFKVRDTYESYVDKKTYLPLYFVRDVYEGGFVIKNNVTFDHQKLKATSTKSESEHQITNCIQDVLSVIYKSRCLNFDQYEIGEKIPIEIFLDNQVYPLYIRYLGKETLKTKLGKFNCIKFKPLLVDGTIFEGGEKMTVWATDDDNKIPIRVESDIAVGAIIVDLIGYKGLKNDFSAMINKR